LDRYEKMKFNGIGLLMNAIHERPKLKEL